MIFDEEIEGPALRKKFDEFYDNQDLNMPDDSKVNSNTDKQPQSHENTKKRRPIDDIASDNEEELEEMDNEADEDDDNDEDEDGN